MPGKAADASGRPRRLELKHRQGADRDVKRKNFGRHSNIGRFMPLTFKKKGASCALFKCLELSVPTADDGPVREALSSDRCKSPSPQIAAGRRTLSDRCVP